MSKYPEHEKIKALKGDNDTIAAFLEWLFEQGATITRDRTQEWTDSCYKRHPEWEETVQVYRDTGGTDEMTVHPPSCICGGAGFQTGVEVVEETMYDITKILAEYFKVDMDKFAAEKDEMLKEIREAAQRE